MLLTLNEVLSGRLQLSLPLLLGNDSSNDILRVGTHFEVMLLVLLTEQCLIVAEVRRVFPAGVGGVLEVAILTNV